MKIAVLAISKIRQREREEMGKKDFTEVIGQSLNNTMAKQNFNNLFGTGEQMEEPNREEPKEPPKAKQKKPIKEKAKAAEQGAFVPVGYVLKEEPKSQRLQLLLKPSTLNGLKEESERTGESVNAICNRLFEGYLKRAKESIL